MLTDLSMSINTANMPNGCALNEFTTSPLNKYDMEWPRPQPGQKPNPSALNGHKEP